MRHVRLSIVLSGCEYEKPMTVEVKGCWQDEADITGIFNELYDIDQYQNQFTQKEK